MSSAHLKFIFPSPSLIFMSLKNINFKIFLTFFLFFISHQHFFYYFLNKKLNIYNINIFTFLYKLFQLYITLTFFQSLFYKKKKIKEKEGVRDES
jgi:hypothetical protein